MPESRIQFGLVATCISTRVVLPLKAVQCEFLVEGGLAQVTVTQVFLQENKAPMDCLYQFPLPADASVYACEAQINARVIRAKVEEREAARRLVKQKKAEGRRTALVESERENLFTLSLGNLQPDDLIEVRLAYLQPLRRSAGSLSVTVPFCPGIRYIPGHPLLRTNRGKGVVDDTDQVPDASRISPVRMDQLHPDAAFVDIGGRIEAGFADAASVTSPSHRVTARSEDGFLRIELDDKGDVPDRDFVLRWKEKPATVTAPRAWICRKDQESYALLEIRAPESISEGAVLPQDVYFLVDRSGSMAGQKWQKAVEALQNCVAVLAPQDRVMVTVFETTFNDFAEAPLPPSELLQDPNFRNLSRMGTGGGTEMGPALTHVLDLIRKHSPGRRTNLVLVTDAQVGNERGILEIMRQAPGLAVHCFGIDIALNDALLLALTRQQGGTFHSLHPSDDLSAAVSTLGRALLQPVLLDLNLSNGWETADHRLPDLYAGQVHYACAKGNRKSSLSINARDAKGKAVAMQFETTKAQNPAPYLHWCKTRIQRLLAEDARSAAAVELSKAANVICELTAFVAWDTAEKVAVATHELIQPSLGLRDADRRDHNLHFARSASGAQRIRSTFGQRTANYSPPASFVAPVTTEVIVMKPPIVVRELAVQLKQEPFRIIADLMELDVYVSVNDALDGTIARQLCAKYGFRLEVEKRECAKGIVIESRFESGSPVATVLVHSGTLRVGNIIICGRYYGKVLGLISKDGQCIKEVGQSTAVGVRGLNGVPEAGVEFIAVEDEKMANGKVEKRQIG
jgi:Ca-activated chloride channel family protein